MARDQDPKVRMTGVQELKPVRQEHVLTPYGLAQLMTQSSLRWKGGEDTSVFAGPCLGTAPVHS